MSAEGETPPLRAKDDEKKATPLVPLRDWPNPQCPCCVCRGIHCLIGHPGHWHQNPDWRRDGY
jgi:hypothetical protein